MSRLFGMRGIFVALHMTLVCAVRHRRKVKEVKEQVGFGNVLPPANPNLTAVAVILNPGGLVPARLYEEHMQRWQAQAERAGLSMWVGVLSYWFDLPLPIRLQANINNALASMKGTHGMPEAAPVFLTGHSMGGGVLGDVALSMHQQGKVQGIILQASYIGVKFFPPMSESFGFPVPTLTVGADLNFGAARITRMAVARYRQRALSVNDYPFVVIEGMNHMQFASGFEKEDLKPEVDTATAQQEVARLSVEFIANQMGQGENSYLLSETRRTDEIFAPINTAFELECDAHFNCPNQATAPNPNCPRGVCPSSSPWIGFAQEHILGKQVTDVVQVQNNYADLNPWNFSDRDGRKPFITEDVQTVQAYVSSSSTLAEFEDDTGIPVASTELLSKFISREEGMLKARGIRTGRDTDYCVELNQIAFDRALSLASPLARQRFEAHGQPMVFKPTKYVFRNIGPLWVSSKMSYREEDGAMAVTSYGLFKEPGNSSSDGNHYCKLLTPARALEWIYVDGLQKGLFGISGAGAMKGVGWCFLAALWAASNI